MCQEILLFQFSEETYWQKASRNPLTAVRRIKIVNRRRKKKGLGEREAKIRTEPGQHSQHGVI